jgi:hypothetical protein
VINLLGNSFYDTIMVVVCFLFAILLLGLVLFDDYVEVESSFRGFQYVQFVFLALFFVDNVFNFVAFRMAYYNNDNMVVCEVSGVLACVVLVYFDGYTSQDFIARVLKFAIIFRKL